MELKSLNKIGTNLGLVSRPWYLRFVTVLSHDFSWALKVRTVSSVLLHLKSWISWLEKRLWSSFVFCHWGECVNLNFNRINFITERLLKSPQNIPPVRLPRASSLRQVKFPWWSHRLHGRLNNTQRWFTTVPFHDPPEQSTLSRHLRLGFRPVKYND